MTIRPTSRRSLWEEGVIEHLAETEDVRPVLADSGVFVLTSYREGLLRSTLEVMSMTMPTVTTEDSGCRETVTYRINDALAHAATRERVLARFSADRLNPLIHDVLGECID